MLFTSITCFVKHARLIILHSIHPKRVLQSCRVNKIRLIASRQPTRQRSIRKNLKSRTSQVARIGMFWSPSVVVLVVYCFIAIPDANCDWGKVLMAVEDCSVVFHHQNNQWEGSFWQIFGYFVDDRIELLSENTTKSVCCVKGANGVWLVVK